MTVQLIRGTHALVSSGHHLASFEAAAVLRGGGNVIDAAVAGAAVLAVALPYACGLGGDLYLLYFDAAAGRLHGLNSTGAAPAAADPARFADGLPQAGPLSITVPGMVAGWAEAARRFGTRPLADLLAPAIAAAEDGIPVHRAQHRNTRDRAALLAADPGAARVFLPGGAPLPEGALLRQADCAATLRRIAADGPDGFYRGAVARRIADHVAAAGGILTAADLAAHAPFWQQPIAAPFHGHDIATMPPNSWGLTLLLQLLELAENGAAPDGAAFYLAGIAARRNAYRAAARAVGDPALTEDAARALLADAIAGRAPAPAGGPRHVPAPPGGDTSVLVVMDAAGNAVSLIQSVSAPYGSGLVADGTGVVLNNRLRGFNNNPDSPNCVGPGKRPAHTLTPAMVLRDGRAVMAIATPGMAGQTCTLAQVLARLLAHRQPLEAAIAAPRWSVTPAGSPIVEDTMDAAVQAAVAAAVPEVKAAGSLTFGSVKAVARDGDGLVAAADFRRVAGAAGW